MLGIDVAAFWLGVAAVIVAWIWRRKHTEGMRHETLRKMLERNEAIDPSLVNDVLNPQLSHDHSPGPEFRITVQSIFRFFGSLILIASPGVGILAAMIVYFEDGGDAFVQIGVGSAVVTLIAGAAIFFSAKFLAPSSGGDSRT